jgi:hypothetical protein
VEQERIGKIFFDQETPDAQGDAPRRSSATGRLGRLGFAKLGELDQLEQWVVVDR